MIEALDFRDSTAVERVLEKSESRVGFPSLLLVADCTYDHELHDPLVSRICDVREAAKLRGVPSCTLLLLHDPRTKEIDEHLVESLNRHRIEYTQEDTSGFSSTHERSGMMLLLRAELV